MLFSSAPYPDGQTSMSVYLGLINAPGGNGAHPNDEVFPCPKTCCWGLYDEGGKYDDYSDTNLPEYYPRLR